MAATGVGIDIVETERFNRFKKGTRHPFITKNFSAAEVAYCMDFKNPSPHLAGVFAAKEAVGKALGEKILYLPDIEILHDAIGRPVAYRKGKKIRSMQLSITHTDHIAVAVAIRI